MVRRIAVSALLSTAIAMAVPVIAQTPEKVVGTLAGWAPPAFTAAAGEEAGFASADVAHNFVTTDAICVDPTGQSDDPLPCSLLIPSGDDPTALPITTVTFHPSAAPGAHTFSCGFHPWMVGQLIIN